MCSHCSTRPGPIFVAHKESSLALSMWLEVGSVRFVDGVLQRRHHHRWIGCALRRVCAITQLLPWGPWLLPGRRGLCACVLSMRK